MLASETEYAMRYALVRKLAGRGDGPGQFSTALRDVHAGHDGLIYAVGDREVKVYDPAGQLVRRWPTRRAGNCVTLQSDGHVYVGGPGIIEVFDRRGRPVDHWDDRASLGFVTAVARYGGELFVADARGRAIRRFDSARQLVLQIGRDTNTRGFAIPNGCLDFELDSAGRLCVAHSGKHRVEWYDLDGRLLDRFGHFGMRDPADFRGCCNPTNIALCPDGRIAVTEKASPRVKLYEPDGKLLAVWADDDTFHPNCKNMAVAAASDGTIYVVDTVRLQILAFQRSD